MTKKINVLGILLCSLWFAPASNPGAEELTVRTGKEAGFQETRHDVTVNDDSDYQKTSRFYEGMFDGGKPNIARLNLFFTRMPKGGDIHHHYTGSIYAETYLDWVAKKAWFIDSCTLKIVTEKEQSKCTALTVDQLMSDDRLYRKLLSLWSDKDYKNHFHEQPPPDSNFFSTFGYFGTVSNEFMDTGLKIIRQRAIDENVSYIETMLAKVKVKSKDFFASDEAGRLNGALRAAKSPDEIYRLLGEITTALKENKAFHAAVNDFVVMVDTNHQGIDSDGFTMRFQAYAARVADPLQVFLELLAGHMAADQSRLVVGVNIVAPENHHVALSDYTLHMQMFRYLHKQYPRVNRALHAGELTLGMVEPGDLGFHIRQAREIANAQRIGHGVDLPYEQQPIELLEDLKRNAAVEINLTSNEFILGVEGRAHPYLIYSSYGVPIVISTDDSGVSRNNLSHEYRLLAARYHPSYEQIKGYVYNSIQYSFLTPDEKLSSQALLDKKFDSFEKEMAGLSERLK